MSLDGKQISELARVTSVRDDSLLVVDNGGTESNSVYVSDLLKKAGNDKQDKLTAGDNIVIKDNVISAPTINARNIGELVPSVLPLTDAGLHLLDGALISGNGIYGDFVDYVSGLYEENPTASYFTSEANWQHTLVTYGSCGKFVYDSVNNTVRLPKIFDIIQGTSDINALGSLVEAGLPNITGYLASIDTGGRWGLIANASANDYNKYSGAFAAQNNGAYTQSVSTGKGVASGDLYFDASRSNPIYGASDTVQPQTIKVLFYIVVANSSRKDIGVNTEKNIVDNNLKADKDFSNVVLPNQNFIQKSISWGIPDYNRGIVLNYTTLQNFKAPSAGILCGMTNPAGSVSGRVYVNGHMVWGGDTYVMSVHIVLDRNDIVTYSGIDKDSYTQVYFYPFKGAY